MTLFNKILIANRGEIACRIIKTAKKLGIKTVAVFSQADKQSMHVQMADEAYLIGPAPSIESYLNIDKILTVAKLSNAQAIHPGYGFLSENPMFAQRCEVAGIIFIGPSSQTMELMADKHAAKEKMRQHNIPTLPSYYIENFSLIELQTQAEKIAFPVVLKAVAGGGGKGLRLVTQLDELEHAYYAVQREAKAFFNDDRVLVEKYLPQARHVEVQILADNFGYTQHLFSRDCSIQRRHQKIVEEAPAPCLSPTLQKAIHTAAIEISKAIDYTNAGTIEFLVEKNSFYFMEMNTRLQVEHPVTEMVTNLDLVEWQIRIAANEPLFQETPVCNDHAIEVRLNAEDPEKDYLPSSGQLLLWNLPQETAYTRIDSGYQQGNVINIYYDSLLAKVIAWGETRTLAINRLLAALNSIAILGIKTNSTLLCTILTDVKFHEFKVDTQFLQQYSFSGKRTNYPVFCAAALFMIQDNKPNNSQSPWQCGDHWRLYAPASIKLNFQHLDSPVIIQPSKTSHTISIGDESFTCQLLERHYLEPELCKLKLIIQDQYHCAYIHKKGSSLEILLNNAPYYVELLAAIEAEQGHELTERLLAPMPGTVVALLVKEGQIVKKGDKLLVIEAMKMEHTIYAPEDAKIKQCYFHLGDIVPEGAELIQFE